VRKASPWIHLGRWALGLSLLSASIVTLGGSAVWRLERDAPTANLEHWGDCLWWATATLTTVGYGEHFPVTLGGRLVAVFIMISGVAIIGAVAAMVAFGFGHRFAARLERAVLQVESKQVEDAGHATLVSAPAEPVGLQELTVSVPDADCAASLTWLLARLGWHPSADDDGLGWAQGGTRLRLAVRPWTTPVGVQGRLTFSAGKHDRMLRISREALRHGFHRMEARAGARVAGSAPATPSSLQADDRVVLRTASGFEVALRVSERVGVS